MPTKNYKLTAEHFYKFFQCPHWIWFDIYGDQQKKKTVPPLMQMIYENGLRHETEMIKSRKFEELPTPLTQDLDEAFLATMELMKKGKNIYHGVLMDEHWVGIPDLLEAKPMSELKLKNAHSRFGDYYYAVYDIKSGKEIKDEYKFQLAFYSLILERIQGILPPLAYIINGEGEETPFAVKDFLEQFHLVREEIERILDGEKPPPFLKSGCKRTPWYSLCSSETESCRDVSLIYRLNQADQRQLYGLGIKTIDDFAKTNLESLREHLPSWSFDKLVRFHNQAHSLVANEAIILKRPDFPEVGTEVYFDMESDPTQNIDYLFGVLIKNKQTGQEEYRCFLAGQKSEEEQQWREFLKLIDGLNDFIIYHYAFYEKRVFDRLTAHYGAPMEIVEKFKNHAIDLLRLVTETAILPLYFYSLKDVARYIGFNWQAEDAGGAQSVVWYNQWKDTGDKAILQKIIDYNKDDVVATARVKEWLEKQRPKMTREILPE